MASLLNTKDALNPRNNLMGRRVRRLIKVNNTITEVFADRTLQRRVTGGKRSVVASANVKVVVTLEEKGPFGRINGGNNLLRLDNVLADSKRVSIRSRKLDDFLGRLLVLLILLIFFIFLKVAHVRQTTLVGVVQISCRCVDELYCRKVQKKKGVNQEKIN